MPFTLVRLKEKSDALYMVEMTFADQNYDLTAYKQDDDGDAEIKVNREMLRRAIGALNSLSSNLIFVVFPSGTKV
jgi:hypothetical protein